MNNLGGGSAIYAFETGDRLCFGGSEPREAPVGGGYISAPVELPPYTVLAGAEG